jgi:hypothetical protein
MLMAVSDSLEQETREFWRLSQVWNGRRTDFISTSEAIHMCNDFQYNWAPHRKLTRVAAHLQDDIVRGTGREPQPTSTVLHFASRSGSSA